MSLAPVTPLFGCFVLGVLLCFGGFVLVFVLACGDFETDYWTMRRSYTSSLLRPLNLQTAMYALIS